MCSETNSILLEGPIDYLVFSSSKITLQRVGSEIVSFAGEIIDHHEGQAKIRILSSSPGGKVNLFCVGETLLLSAPYKSMQLCFEAEIIDFNDNLKVLTANIANQGILNEKRTATRKRIGENSTLEADFKIDSLTHNITGRSTHLVDFTSSTVSLLVDRAQGLALPEDVVTSLCIQSNGQPVLNSDGVIERIDMNNHDYKQSDEYLMVINLGENITKTVVDFNTNNRRSDRTILINEKSAFIQFNHPLLDHALLTFRIADLSNSGLSIVMDEIMQPLPKGLLVNNASIQLPFKPRLLVSFTVVSVQDIETEDDFGQQYIQRVGLQLSDLTPDALKEITNFVQKDKSEYLIDACDDDYDKLWEFYFETGFIYGSKRKQLQNHAKEVMRTYRILLTSNTSLLKKVLYKQDGEIKGHVNAVKIFDHTLIMQHLNALKASGASAAQAVIRGMTSFLLDYQANKKVSYRYVCSYYRPNNLYPALVFGETANLIKDEKICWTRVYDFCLPSEQPLEISQDVKCTEASPEDLKNLEMLLIQQNEQALMRVESLTRESFLTMKVSPEYQKIGLYRYRKVFVAHDPNTSARGYAICTYTSPGINFSELTNSVKFFYSCENSKENTKLADALGQAILKSYQDTTMPNCVLLLSDDQPLPAGYSREKSYVMWVLDINYTSKFREATENIFSNLKHYIRTYKNIEKRANAGRVAKAV